MIVTPRVHAQFFDVYTQRRLSFISLLYFKPLFFCSFVFLCMLPMRAAMVELFFVVIVQFWLGGCSWFLRNGTTENCGWRCLLAAVLQKEEEKENKRERNTCFSDVLIYERMKPKALSHGRRSISGGVGARREILFFFCSVLFVFRS